MNNIIEGILQKPLLNLSGNNQKQQVKYYEQQLSSEIGHSHLDIELAF
jgi:hypothetical protein